jgi:hypothetical protein
LIAATAADTAEPGRLGAAACSLAHYAASTAKDCHSTDIAIFNVDVDVFLSYILAKY